VHRSAPAVLVCALLLAASHPLEGAEKKDAQKTPAEIVAIVEPAAGNVCFVNSIQADGVLAPASVALVYPDSEGYRIDSVDVREGQSVASGRVLARLTRAGQGGAPAATVSVTAPASGVITRSRAVVGAPASARGEPLFEIAIGGVIEFIADVPSLAVAELLAIPERKWSQTTARVELASARDLSGRSEGNRDLTGTLRKIPGEIDPKTQLAHVRIRVENYPALRVGTFGRATIHAGSHCGVAVPKTSVLGESVKVVHNGIVETRHVRVGLASECQFEILEGVAEGETVVRDAGTSLRDGAKVKTKSRDETDSGAC
jgi:multidrug efflux pump subunit AcrA (membrane-fusion protein)